MFGLLSDAYRRHVLLTLLTGAGLAAYLTGSVRAIYDFDLAMLLALVGGAPVYYSAVQALLRGKIVADLAVALAAFAALFVGYRSADPSSWFVVAAEVIFIMLIGESLEHFVVDRTRHGIAALLRLRPDSARVRRADKELDIPAHDILPSDVVLVRPGDRIPVDGRVLRGTSAVDQSPITGESLPADKSTGDEVFAGTINLFGALELSVQRLGHDTTLERIIHLVEHAEAAKAPTERLADRYATYFVPIVLVASAVTWFFTRDISRAVAVLVVACPCGLVLATPTAIAAGIGYLVRRGILVKGGVVLEQLGRLKAIVFDKTGTLTLAKPRIEAVVTTPDRDEATLLRLAGAVERHSEHPLAKLIAERAAAQGLDLPEAEQFVAHPGMGAEAMVAGSKIRVGSPRYIEQAGATAPEALAARVRQLAHEGCTIVLVARGEQAIGAIGIRDTLRPEAQEAVYRLQQMGIARVVMLTGDHEPAARAVAESLGIEDFRAGLLPADKVEAIRGLQRAASPVAMVGDGVNDAPSLVTADVGVAMADIGSDVAIESADLVLLGDDLRKVPEAVACSRRVLRTIRQNIIVFVVVLNVVSVAAASLGWISPVVAAVLHQCSSLTVVLNSLRLLFDARRLAERLHDARHYVVEHRRRLLGAAGALAAVVYLASGLHVVGLGDIGVVQRFGKIVLPVEEPGLHYRLPYPLAQHYLLRRDDVRRVEVGYRTAALAAGEEPPAYEWNVQHTKGRYVRQKDEAEMWVGDENLVDVNFVIHYRLDDPVAAMFRLGPQLPQGGDKWETLVRDVAESAFRIEMSRRPADDLLESNRHEIADAVLARARQNLAQYGVGLEIIDVCLRDVHPPEEVVNAYREVSSALEEKEAQINEAEAYKYQTEALGRGQAAERIAQAEGLATDRTAKAAAAAQRFEALAQAFAVSPEVARLRLYLQTVESALAGRRKVILDAAAHGARRMLYLGRKGLSPAAATPVAPLVAEPSVDSPDVKGTTTP